MLVNQNTNVIAFRPKVRPTPRPQPNRWSSPESVERVIAEVAAEPEHALVDRALISLQLASFRPQDDLSMACAFKALLRLCRALDYAGFPVPAFGSAM